LIHIQTQSTVGLCKGKKGGERKLERKRKGEKEEERRGERGFRGLGY